MATTEVARPSPVSRAIGFIRDARAEMDRVTWPDKPQFKQACIYVVAFSVIVGIVIAVMDLVLQGILVNLIPAILGR